MKRVFVILLGLLALNVCAQTAFWNSVRPDASVVITKHNMGADLVEVTVAGEFYSRTDLEAHIVELGKQLGAEPRGLVFSGAGDTVLKANFAVNGLISDTDPRFNLPAIARAFSFGRKPLKQLSVFFVGLLPDARTPARWFAPKDAWMLEAIGMKAPAGIEYRIKVNTSDPNEVTLPGANVAKDNASVREARKKPDYLLIGGAIGAAIAVGLLVYSALIRGQRRPAIPR